MNKALAKFKSYFVDEAEYKAFTQLHQIDQTQGLFEGTARHDLFVLADGSDREDQCYHTYNDKPATVSWLPFDEDESMPAVQFLITFQYLTHIRFQNEFYNGKFTEYVQHRSGAAEKMH